MIQSFGDAQDGGKGQDFALLGRGKLQAAKILPLELALLEGYDRRQCSLLFRVQGLPNPRLGKI